MLLNLFRNIAFSKNWFGQFNYLFTYLLNNKNYKIRCYLRDKLQLNDFDYNVPIYKVSPNSVHYVYDNRIVAVCYSLDLIANNLKKEFENIFIALHNFDIKIANKFFPILNLGYDTLTQYSTTGDGVVQNSGTVWATVRNAASGTAASTNGTSPVFRTDRTGSTYSFNRLFFYFDTTSIGAGSTVANAIFSLYASALGTSGSSFCALKGTQSATLATTNFQSFSTYYGFISPSVINSYNDIAVLGADIVTTETTLIAAREYTKDYLNVAPGIATQWGQSVYMADNTTNKPKLIVTYSLPSSARSYIY